MHKNTSSANSTTDNSGASCVVRSPYGVSAPGVAEEGPAAGAAGRSGPGVPAPVRRRLRRRALRERRVHPRFDNAEFAVLQRAAALCSMPVGGYVAEAALAAARAENPEAAVADYRRLVRELMASHRQLAAIGNNLNQLARHLNLDGARPAHSATLRLLDQVRATVDNVDAAVDTVIRR